ncbi:MULTISPECIES: zinc-finger-containing protein [unclassified Bradyrhizobium]|uniref:zinc-finger-containing protein n=1 Tax=unclassified Bradyrhizobium TaxID=2631580 RepID=UPI001FFFC675|nr:MULTISPECIES: zinc-finger-containing protein [unclassified Bradyrhizobium]
MARGSGYRWLSEQLGINRKRCQIGMFDVETCRRVVEICSPLHEGTRIMHSFDIDLAAEVRVEAAIIFSNIEHWCLRNALNGQNVRDGHATALRVVRSLPVSWREANPQCN